MTGAASAAGGRASRRPLTIGSGEVIRRSREEFAMRWVHLTIIVLFAVVTLIFALQNLESVTVSFLGLSVRTPLAILVFIAYVLGAATGGSLFALLRRSYQGSRRGSGTSS
jgi:lipopolysaccharide assembly protein A